MWISVNSHASEPLRDPLPPFQAVGTTAQPMRNYCPLLRFGCYVVFDDCQRSTISSLCGRRRAKRRTVRVLLHACNIFAPTPTNNIKFPVCGSLFLYVPAPQVSQERSVNAKIIAPFRTSPHRFCYPPAIQSIRWRLHSMSNSRAAAEQ